MTNNIQAEISFYEDMISMLSNSQKKAQAAYDHAYRKYQEALQERNIRLAKAQLENMKYYQEEIVALSNKRYEYELRRFMTIDC